MNKVLLISVFHNSERISGNLSDAEFFNWRNTAFIVTRLEVLDQRNGFGGESFIGDGGIDRRFVRLRFTSGPLDTDIDFIVNIYGEPVVTNDFIQGEITDTSNLVHRYD